MTEQDKKEYHKKVNENIIKFGYHLTFVFPDTTPSFCYSTGVYRSFKIPEVFISSLPENLSFELMKNYIHMFKETKNVPLDTKINNLSDRFPVYLIDAPIASLKDYVLSSIKYYDSEEFKYIQIIYPDTKGHFPNDFGYDYDQQIIGEFKQ